MVVIFFTVIALLVAFCVWAGIKAAEAGNTYGLGMLIGFGVFPAILFVGILLANRPQSKQNDSSQ